MLTQTGMIELRTSSFISSWLLPFGPEAWPPVASTKALGLMDGTVGTEWGSEWERHKLLSEELVLVGVFAFTDVLYL